MLFSLHASRPSTDSCVHVGKCAGNKIHRHDPESQKIGRHNRMAPTCRADILDMLATDIFVCRWGGGADRHICQYCQPRPPVVRYCSPLLLTLPAFGENQAGCHLHCDCLSTNVDVLSSILQCANLTLYEINVNLGVQINRL